MSEDTNKKGYLYGTTTVSEKGQVVIPKEARDKLDITAGDKLLVLDGGGKGMLGLAKADQLRGVIEELTGYLKELE